VPACSVEPEHHGRRALAGILLAPGAGGSSESPAMAELAAFLEANGVAVQCMDFPYRLAGRRRPDPPAVLEATVRERASAFAEQLGTRTDALVLGGRSMGGRICSQVVAERFPAAGLALVSYPLHPPGRPERMRISHFPQLRVPCLFVSGTRDAFAAPDELEAATARIPGRVVHVWLKGGDHGLRTQGAAAAAAVLKWVTSTFELSSSGGTLSS
jgi:predicted alpha/beta-hydrolase family hydrolase